MKEYKRYIIEFFLVFFSVFAAFIFENYRVELEKEGDYLESLRDFQTDLRKNIFSLKFEIDSTATNLSGYRNLFQQYYTDFINLSIDGKPDELMGRLLIYFKLKQVPPVEWIFPSVQYDKLMSDYFEQIKSDTLKNYLAQYQRRFLQRETSRKNELTKWQEITDLIDRNYQVVPADSLF
ncbi:MAG: hypothetical protein KDD94_10565, partial [Calditrichaeota bacterium]|nr:hypothetical protein [Calditrichota bacterium]